MYIYVCYDKKVVTCHPLCCNLRDMEASGYTCYYQTFYRNWYIQIFKLINYPISLAWIFAPSFRSFQESFSAIAALETSVFFVICGISSFLRVSIQNC